MKITVKGKKEENHKILFDEIPIGYVYVAARPDGPILLKLDNNEAVLLTYSSHSEDWFAVTKAGGYKGEPAYKVLGKLVEIIVKEV